MFTLGFVLQLVVMGLGMKYADRYLAYRKATKN